MTEGDLIEVWRHAQDNHDEIRRSNSCRCIMCRHRFAPSEISRWCVIDGDLRIVEKNPLGKRRQIEHATAICPYCDSQHVVGDASGYPLNDADFLSQVFDVGPLGYFDAAK